MKAFPIKSLRILSLFFIVVSTLSAQDSKVTTGVINFNQGNYADAIENLNTALQNPEALKPKNVSKGYFYLGKSLSRLYDQADASGDQEKIAKYSNALIDAYNSYKKCEASVEAESYKRELETEFSKLYFALSQKGLQIYNEKEYKSALEYLNPAVDIANNYSVSSAYFSYNVRGQVNLLLKNFTTAQQDFEMCLFEYNNALPTQPDFQIGYVYARLGTIYRYAKHNLDSALYATKEGKKFMEREYERYKLSGATDPKITEIYNHVKADLIRFELDIYLNTPNKLTEAVQSFEKALNDFPEETLIRLGYASLLEKTDKEKAIEQYLIILEKDPENFYALFNLGSLYVNQGVEYYKSGNESNSSEASLEYKAKGNKIFMKAFTYLQKAQQADNTDLETLKALTQITSQLEMTEDYNYYKEQMHKISGY